MDGQYRKGDRTMSTNEWLLTSDFWRFLEPWHGRCYENEIFIASCTDNIYDLENERWLLGDMIDHVGIYGSRVAEGLSAFNVSLVYYIWNMNCKLKYNSVFLYETSITNQNIGPTFYIHPITGICDWVTLCVSKLTSHWFWQWHLNFSGPS